MTTHTDIVILGAGIGGFETFRSLDRLLRQNGLNKKITIIDENNYFTFTPLLHEVATGSVEPSHATVPLRELVQHSPHTFLKATVINVDPIKKIVTTTAGTVTYDYVVLALGSSVNFFGVPGADTYAYTVRTLSKAMNFREKFIEKLDTNPKTLDLVVVGGGFTGIEVVGQLASFKKKIRTLYPHTAITISLIEASKNLVPQLPPRAQQFIARHLKKNQVTLYFEQAVQEVKKGSVVLTAGAVLPSDFTLWSAGVGNVADHILPSVFCTKGRLPVTGFLNHASFPTLYGVGDAALIVNPGAERPVPQLGEAAHRAGDYVAHHIIATLRHKKIAPFYFKSMGTLMTLGDQTAIVTIGPLVFSGFFAWWLRRTVYVMFMPGLWRKLKIIMDWTLHLFDFGYIIAIDQKK